MNNLIDASSAFLDCQSLENIDLPVQMNSLKLTDNMFKNCINLIYINLEFLSRAHQWTSSIGMFEGCISLNEINFPYVEANLLRNTSRMFSGCSGLTSINLEKFCAREITSLDYMFSGCINLIYLNIYNLDTRNDPDCYGIFEDVPKIKNITYNPIKTGSNFLEKIKQVSFE